MMLVLKIILIALLITIIGVDFCQLASVSAQKSNRNSFKKIIDFDDLYVKNGLLENKDTESVARNIFVFFIYLIIQALSFYFAYQNDYLIILGLMIFFVIYDLGNVFLHFVYKHYFHKNILVIGLIRKAIVTGNSKCIKHVDVMWTIDLIFSGIIVPVIYVFGIL